jgi:hypothetical protein
VLIQLLLQRSLMGGLICRGISPQNLTFLPAKNGTSSSIAIAVNALYMINAKLLAVSVLGNTVHVNSMSIIGSLAHLGGDDSWANVGLLFEGENCGRPVEPDPYWAVPNYWNERT